MKILQCGYGKIGKALYENEFLPLAQACDAEIFVYDPFVKNVPQQVNDLNDVYEVAFICVPTDKKDDGSVNIDEVLKCCREVKANIIVIKSTVPVSIIEHLPANAIFSPEFTGTTQHSGRHEYMVLAGDRKLCNKVSELYKSLYDASYKFYFTDIKTAILAKYAENCWLATKVTFFNEIAQACKSIGVEYEDVRNILLADSRINPSHTFVYENQPFYDSHCLNKDVPAFIQQFDLPLMKAVSQINCELKDRFKLGNKSTAQN